MEITTTTPEAVNEVKTTSSVKAKKSPAKKKEVKKEKTEKIDLTKVNLSKISQSLAVVQVNAKRKKETIYKYPDNFTTQMINNEDGKHYRNKMRAAINRISNNVLFAAKQYDVNKGKKDANDFLLSLKKEVKIFTDFYKANYRVNDFSIESISRKKDAAETNLKLFLQVVNEVRNK